MAESHVVSGLVAKKSELAGLVKHYQAEIVRIGFDLKHLDATIKLFAPDFDLRKVKSKEHRERNSYFKSGESIRLTLDVLRIANSPCHHNEIVQQIVISKGFESDPHAVQQTHKTIYRTLVKLANKGTVRQNKVADRTVSWQLV